ncbi:MAG: hypothetical protein ABJO67_08655, partial [Pseudoruegeria sp.]
MSFTSLILGVGGILLSLATFLLGKIYAQTEIILDRKRDAYREFLSQCPCPNEAHTEVAQDYMGFQRNLGVLTIYGSKESLECAGKYFTEFASAQEVLIHVETAGHPAFIKLMTCYNKMIWEMRN